MNTNYLDDLSDLEDVFGDVDEDWDNELSNKTDDDDDDDLLSCMSFTSSDEMEIVESTLEDMYEYIEDNPNAICDTDFHDVITEYIQDLLNVYFENLYFDRIEDYFKDEIKIIIDKSFELFYNMYPRRSYPNTRVLHKPDTNEIQEKIKKIKNKNQPSQRTSEWYTYRHNLITASNAYKVFENESSRNQLIYEKCVPPYIPNSNPENSEVSYTQVNVNSALHWGQKYEPISVMVYEHLYKTTVGDFGCIQHDTYGFIGASPDGINIDPNSPIYGRMLEIKNPVSREIDGVPKKEYWVQMQQQMEVCDLDECDFLETKFTEYVNEDEFNKDGEFAETSTDGNMKGIIMYFSNKNGIPVYKYKPLHIDNHEDFEIWEEQQMEENEDTMTWIKNIYWKLEQISCVLVQRNQKWFHDNVGAMKELWEIVEKERQTGFSHREPKKRAKKAEAHEPVGSGCLISIKKNNEAVSCSPPVASSPIIKIRTESIDETQEMMMKTQEEDFV
uniref:YqaJ viral recombinase domain-containing protein n=1 Tax=viral metagenome TaxID=1070528 RepID=A0A6C0BXA9_9ZZZZ